MIGEEEAALWGQAVESAGALDVYLDWLLIHDPIRGACARACTPDPCSATSSGTRCAIARSPLGKTLRRLELAECDLGDAGALALAGTQLEELVIDCHHLGPHAAAALRAMPSLSRLKLVPEV